MKVELRENLEEQLRTTLTHEKCEPVTLGGWGVFPKSHFRGESGFRRERWQRRILEIR